MKRFGTFIVMAFLAAPAMAQENMIKVIQPDGSEATLELPGHDSTTIQKRIEAPRKPAPIETIQKPDTATATAPAPKAPPIDVPQKPQIKPETKQAVIKAPQRPIKQPPKPKVKKQPLPPKEGGIGKVVTPKPEAVPGDVVVTEKLAKRIALKIAPPARDIKVMYRTYEEKPAYLVRFKTDDGLFDVLVDMVTGDILATKKP